MMQPTPRCLWALGAGIPVALLPELIDPALWIVWLIYLAAVLLLAGSDLLLAVRPRSVTLNVEVPRVVYIGEHGALTARVRAAGRATISAALLLCDLSELLEPQVATTIAMAGTQAADCQIALVPRRRGIARVERVWLRWSGPLGLFHREKVFDVQTEVSVIPNIRAVRTAAFKCLSRSEFLSGLKTQRYPGDGSEFETLREYLPGLDHRALHWKASARHRKLLCREFRAERDQQIVIALDTGHLMQEPLEGVPKLDRAINAGLLLAYFSLRSGDRTGLFAFDRRVQAYCAPSGGVGSFNRLQLAAARLEYSSSETNFTLGLAELSTRLRRRCLVVLLTDFVDTVTAELMVENLGLLAQRHLVLFVTLRDRDLDRIISAPPTAVADMVRSVVAADVQRDREIVLRRLVRLGIHTIDAPPDHITMELLNRYLEIKRRELIA